MSAVEKARELAARAAVALRDAKAAAEAEARAVAGRNAERTAAFWQDAGQRIADATATTREARAQVVTLLTSGDGSAALDAFLTYRRRHAELETLIHAGRAATATYVWTESTSKVTRAERASAPQTAVKVERRMAASEYHRQHDELPGDYRMVYGAGVPQGAPTADSWERLLAEGLEAGQRAAEAAYRDALLAPLHAVLEPEA